MKLPVKSAAALSLATLLAACGGHHDRVESGSPAGPMRSGPAADYPMVLGEPFVVDGVTYTPEDKMNYDGVGYAAIGAGEGVTIAHRTLPLPSYAEVTSLDSGRTVLVRVERRGPMTGGRLIELSPAAAAQLGIGADRAAIRVRRVNPPEQERALLRSGQTAPARMDTPMSLVSVLRRKLEPGFVAPAAAPQTAAASTPKPVAPPKKQASAAPVVKPPKPAPPVKAAAPAVVRDGFVVQVGAFATEARGKEVAQAVGGQMARAGSLTRVRMGPFATQAEAAAALAKARAAGYSEARIQRAD